jgi:hypothetical protein
MKLRYILLAGIVGGILLANPPLNKQEKSLQYSSESSIYSKTQRWKKLENLEGLPKVIFNKELIEKYKGDWYSTKRLGFINLCIYGDYNEEKFYPNTPSPELIKELLEVYGWDISGFNNIKSIKN